MKSATPRSPRAKSLPDTVRTLEAYADVIVLRHPEIGAAALAARYARKPVINAGDGAGEHPTQALLDLFTIEEELHRLDGLTVTMAGDLKYGRTVHSLARLLSLYGVRLNYVSPEILRMPAEIMAEIAQNGIPQTEHRTLEPILAETDVLYVTRVQKERFENPEDYELVKDAFVITPELLCGAKEEMIVMHPLPRGRDQHGCPTTIPARLLPPDGIRPVHPHGPPGPRVGQSMSASSFFSLLEARVRQADSLLCVGLDPHPTDLPHQTAAAAREFCLRLIEATSHLVAGV